MSAPDGDDPDLDLWQAYAERVRRTTTRKSRPVTQPLKTKKLPPQSPSALTLHELAALNHRTAAKRHAVHSLATKAPSTEALTFDRKTERQLRNGNFVIEARLDLHGMTQPEAHSALTRFIHTQRKLGHRKLLIITGKGRGREGILRTNLLTWLESMDEASDILTVRQASLRHGGDGAFYVLLKRTKR